LDHIKNNHSYLCPHIRIKRLSSVAIEIGKEIKKKSKSAIRADHDQMNRFVGT
jgi:hypothetical protein